jgi:hypothetical protein
MCVAYLLGGDDDLREGVEEAQELGIVVNLIGIEPLEELTNQAPSLIRAADHTVQLTRTEIERFLSVSGTPRLSRAESPFEGAKQAARDFCRAWKQKASHEVLAEVRKGKPHIPGSLDGELLSKVSRAIGLPDLEQDIKRVIRVGFWTEFECVEKPSTDD